MMVDDLILSRYIKFLRVCSDTTVNSLEADFMSCMKLASTSICDLLLKDTGGNSLIHKSSIIKVTNNKPENHTA